MDAISRQVLDLWNRYKPTIAVDAIEYDGELKKLLGTNLAEVGTDAINREDAIKIVQNRCKRLTTGCVLAVTEIERLPAIQPKRGRWHYSDGKPARIGLSYGVICDQCGTESEYCTNFCPNCGADMRGEQDG